MGMQREEFTEGDARIHVPDYDAAVECYRQHGGTFHSMSDMGAELRNLSRGGLAAALNNGLDDAQNEELIFCSDPIRIAELVLTGLSRIGSASEPSGA